MLLQANDASCDVVSWLITSPMLQKLTRGGGGGEGKREREREWERERERFFLL